MKIIDYIKLNRKNFFNKLHIILIAILSLILLCLLNFKYNFNHYIDNTIINNPWFRVLVVGPKIDTEDNGLNELENIPNVSLVYSTEYDYISLESNYKNDIYDGFIDLNYGSNSLLPQNIIGRRLTDDDSGVAICPVNFFPTSDAMKLTKDVTFLDSSKLLNSTFSVKYYSRIIKDGKVVNDKEYSKNFKIIGLYNNEDLMLPSNNCFISASDIKEIINISKIQNAGSSGFMVIVDKLDNVKNVLNNLNDLGFNANIKLEYDTSLIQKIITIVNVFIIVIVGLIILINIYFLKKILLKDENNIGILYSLGFSTKMITKIYLWQLILNTLIAYFIAIVFSGILFIVIKYILKTTMMLIAYNMVYHYFEILIGAFLFIIIPIIYFLLYIRNIVNSNIVNLLRNGE